MPKLVFTCESLMSILRFKAMKGFIGFPISPEERPRDSHVRPTHYLKKLLYQSGCPDSVVVITPYRCQGDVGSNPAQGKSFFFLHTSICY